MAPLTGPARPTGRKDCTKPRRTSDQRASQRGKRLRLRLFRTAEDRARPEQDRRLDAAVFLRRRAAGHDAGGRSSNGHRAGRATSGFHNRAAFVAYQPVPVGGHMRLIFGIIIGAALTVGVAYIADAMASTEAKPIVNWSVVAEHIDTLTALAREGWKRIAG